MSRKGIFTQDRSSTELLSADPARQAAFEAMVRQFGNALLRFTRRRLRDPQDAHDAFVDLCLYASRHFSVWQMQQRDLLYFKLRQIICDHLRRRSTKKFLLVTADSDYVYDERLAGPPSPLSETEQWQTFWENFPKAEISEEERQLFWLSAYHGYTLQEIAQRTGLPTSTVHDRLARLREECISTFERDR